MSSGRLGRAAMTLLQALIGEQATVDRVGGASAQCPDRLGLAYRTYPCSGGEANEAGHAPALRPGV